MKQLVYYIKKLHDSRFIRVAFFGGVGVIVQTAVFELLGIWLAIIRPSLATLLGAECGVITSFILNNAFSFADRNHGTLYGRIIRYHAVVSGSLFIQWLSVFIAESLHGGVVLLHGAYISGIIIG